MAKGHLRPIMGFNFYCVCFCNVQKLRSKLHGFVLTKFQPNPPQTSKTRVQNHLLAEVKQNYHRTDLHGAQICSINFRKELPYEMHQSPPYILTLDTASHTNRQTDRFGLHVMHSFFLLRKENLIILRFEFCHLIIDQKVE